MEMNEMEMETEKLKFGNGRQKLRPGVSGQCAYRCSYSGECELTYMPSWLKL